MAKNNLAGLAALGALGMMMSKGKETEVQDRTGPGAGIPYDYGGSGDSEVETFPNQLPSDRKENFSNEGRSGYVKPPVSAPKVRSSKPRGPNPALQSNIDPESMRRMVTGMGGYTGMDEAGRPYRPGMKKGGVVKMAKGGMTSSASSRADGIAQKGKTRGKMC
jgi:hypothetical protein